jgi:hypothetical protein
MHDIYLPCLVQLFRDKIAKATKSKNVQFIFLYLKKIYLKINLTFLDFKKNPEVK